MEESESWSTCLIPCLSKLIRLVHPIYSQRLVHIARPIPLGDAGPRDPLRDRRDSAEFWKRVIPKDVNSHHAPFFASDSMLIPVLKEIGIENVLWKSVS